MVFEDDLYGNVHPSMRACFSATVELWLHVGERKIALGQLGPGFAILRDANDVEAGMVEIESTISGKSTRWPVHLAKPITTASKRFTF
jgi:hypothetical protein